MPGIIDQLTGQSTEPAEAAPPSTVPPYFNEALEGAERMLHYAAEIGVPVDPDTRDAVIAARTQGAHAGEQEVAGLLVSLTTLSAKLRPVTAESLKACSREEKHVVQSYLTWAICLAVFIIPFSFASFVTSAISDAARKDIDSANALAVKLSTQVRPAAGQSAVDSTTGVAVGVQVLDVVTELQQFASLTRSIDGRALQLNRMVLFLGRDPFADVRQDRDKIHETFQLPPDLTLHLQKAFDDRVVVYQDTRYFAQTLVDDVAWFYGGIAACLLPMLYALLGACAYLLRSFDDQTQNKTFVPSVANSARFLIAAIGGAVVGLFNNFTLTQSASIPPLAIAFLVGYAADVFFSFLESLLRTFGKSNADPHPAAAPPAAAPPAPGH